jgi:hypothetical protein
MTSGVRNTGVSEQAYAVEAIPEVVVPTQGSSAEQTVVKTINLVMDGLRQFDSAACVEDGARTERSVVVLGYTGVGKTALMNLIAGRQLYTVYDKKTDRTTIDVPEPMEGFIVGNRTLSETTIPHKWVDPNGVTFWDCPGFEDNRGDDQEIANAVCVRKIFEVSEQTKLLIVVKDPDFGATRCDKLRDFVRLLNDSLLSKVTEISRKVTLVVSQAPLDRTVEEVQGRIERLKEDLVDEAQIDLLKAFQDCPIAIFNEPSNGKTLREGEKRLLNTQQTRTTIFDHVNRIQYAEKRNVQLCLSERAKLVARDSSTALVDQIKESVHQLMEAFGGSIQSLVIPYVQPVDLARLQQDQDRLESILKKLELLVLLLKVSFPVGSKLWDDQVDTLIEKCEEIAQECGLPITEAILKSPSEKLKLLGRLEDVLNNRALNRLSLIRIIRDKVNETLKSVQGAITGIEAIKATEKAAEAQRIAEASEQKAQDAEVRAEALEEQKNVAEAVNQETQTKLKAEEEARKIAQQAVKAAEDSLNAAEERARVAEERRRALEEERWAADRHLLISLGGTAVNKVIDSGCKLVEESLKERASSLELAPAPK